MLKNLESLVKPAERLCLGCGVRSDKTFCPIPPQDRSGLFKATVRLMRLMLSNSRLPDITDDEQQLWNVLRPLVYNRDGHFLATLSALLFFFGCQLLGYVSRAVRPSVSYNNAKRAIPIS